MQWGYHRDTGIHVYIWVNYNDLTVLPNPGIMVSKEHHPKYFLIYPIYPDIYINSEGYDGIYNQRKITWVNSPPG